MKKILMQASLGLGLVLTSSAFAAVCTDVNPSSEAWTGTGSQNGEFSFINNSTEPVSIQLQMPNSTEEKQNVLPNQTVNFKVSADGASQLNVWNSTTITGAAYCVQSYTTSYNSGLKYAATAEMKKSQNNPKAALAF